MIRLTLLWLFIAFLAGYAWKDWYKALCGLILLMAVIEHPDMPKSLFEIQGLNPWNILLLVICCAWFTHRSGEGLLWDMPRKANNLLFCYLIVIFVSFFRMMADTQGIIEFAQLRGSEIPSTSYLISEHFINGLKWIVPGVLFFDGCRSKERFAWGLCSFLLVYFLLAVQVVKWMPLSGIQSGGELTARSLKILSNEIGYHRVNMSMMLAGAFWAIVAIRPLASGRVMLSKIILLAAGTVMLGQALTGGRTGYGTWAVVGILLGVARWRKMLFWIPALAMLVIMAVPAVRERMFQGFSEESRDRNVTIEREFGEGSGTGPDLYTVTAGRSFAWPFVIEEIKESPFIGYGKEAMQRTGISATLFNNYGESFPHPHNAYLQLVLDNGVLGAIPVLLFYTVVLRYAFQLFRDSRRPEFIAIGGCTLALVLALLIASIGSQTFYPREGAVGMWCAIGLMLRVYVQRSRLDITTINKPAGIDETLLWGKSA